MKYLLAFLVLSVIIIVHELGHFIIAKASGVVVTEFSLGMGPRILKFTRKGTMYSIKLFFFGGSCRMLGEEEDDNSEGSFNSKSVWKRMAIIVAGPLFNFIFAFVLAVILIGKAGYDPCVVYSVNDNSAAYDAGLESGDHIVKINGKNINFYGDYSLYLIEHEGEVMDITYERDGKKYTTTLVPEYIAEQEVYQMGVQMNADTPTLYSVIEDTPAEKAGLQKGDRILSINGIEINITDEVSGAVQQSAGRELTVVVERDGEEMTFTFTPEKVMNDAYYDMGMYMSAARVHGTPWETIKYSFKEVGYWIETVFKSFKFLFTGKASVNDVAGPVGIVTAIGDVVDESKSDGAMYVFLNLVNWSIMISANLGVMNLLPIPALDGGRLMFLIIEAVRRKPVPRDKEGMVHFVGIVLLMIIMVAVLFNDIRKLF